MHLACPVRCPFAAIAVASFLTIPVFVSGVDTTDRCDYAHTYNDVHTGISHDYQCPRPRHDGGRSCIFHTTTGASHDEIRQAFLSEVRSGPDDNKGNPLRFIGCRIPAVDVDGISTKRVMYFTNAKFLGDVAFANVSCGAVDFTDAEFAGQLRMTATTADVVKLRKSRFDSGYDKASNYGGGKTAVDLRGCRFKSCDMALAHLASARLEDCKIGAANFRESEIDDLSAERCDFANTADFSACRLGHAQFLEVAFGGTATFEHTTFGRAGRFVRAHFFRPETVRFGRSLSNVSLLGTDVTRIRFDADAVWNDGSDPYAILDERELAAGRSAVSPSDVLAVYRSLRECHEYWLMYGEAGQFYIKEMDLRRRYRTDGGGAGKAHRGVGRYISLANGYNVLCRYGESLGRASAWVAGVFGVSVIYYFLAPDPFAPGTQGDHLTRLAAALERTLAAFLHVGKGGVDDYMVRVASLPTLGSMFIVLKRRLERKLRH